MNKHPLDALKLVLFYRGFFRPGFERYLTKHWRSIREFFAVADDQWRQNVVRGLSARNVAECIRNQGFKMDGNFVPDVALLYEAMTGRHGLFVTRKRRFA